MEWLDWHSRITGLYLENFMSIRGPIHLDIEPITLLYGPNSAGKSAIFSAIELVGQFRTIQEYARHHLQFEKYAYRGANKITIGVKTKVKDCYFLQRHIVENLLHISPDSLDQIFPILDTYFCDIDGEERPLLFEAFFDINTTLQTVVLRRLNERDQSLLEFDNDGNAIFFLDHPIIAAIDADLTKYRYSFKSLFAHVFYEDHLILPGNILHTPVQFEIYGDILVYDEDFIRDGLHGSKERLMIDLLLRIIMIFPLHHLYRLCDDMCHIGPLRHIPTDKQLIFFAKKYSSYVSFDSPDTRNWSWKNGTLAWKKLAESRYHSNHPDLERSDRIDKIAKLIDEVNGWLVSNQRLGMQHKIRSTLREICQLTNNEPLSHSNALNRQPHGLFPDQVIKLELEDIDLDIPVSVRNVGAGVPQIVPVIVAGLTEPNIFIEQPELHLHPKIQTELMDFFISCMNIKAAWFIIETHSEYLALRLLRRVRETHAAHIKHHDFSITEDKIAFYYFDPIDGKTEIKRLRVSGDGEFLDRWPKGFFSEREAEIFDEDD